MGKIITFLCFILCLSVLCTNAAAAGTETAAAGPSDTGDFFSVIITMLLASAMGIAVLVANRTRLEEKNKDGRR